MEPPIGNGNGSVNSSSHDFLAAQKPKLPTPSKINASPIRYNPKIIQEPCRSRMSGLSSSTSRRMLDPPLVLEVDFEELNPGRNIPSYLLSNLASKLVCQVFLSDIDNDSELLSFASTIFRVFPQLTSFHQIGSGRSNSAYQDHLFPVLLGETCRGCNFIESIHERRLLFVFADLCIRLQGSFRIHCLVTDPTTGRVFNLASKQHVEIYTPQDYPGLMDVTPLSKWLHSFGFPLRIRTAFHGASSSANRASPESANRASPKRETSTEITDYN